MSPALLPPLPHGGSGQAVHHPAPLPGIPTEIEIRPQPREIPPVPAFADPQSPVRPDFTDADLRAALGSLLPLPAAPAISGDLEPLLRNILRRTLAEHARGPFEEPDPVQKLKWRIDALFTSRSYEEVVESRIRRFHVEECYLFDSDDFVVISYASANPARHTQPRKVTSTAARLSHAITQLNAREHVEFPFENDTRALVRIQHGTALAVIFRGRPDADAAIDLDCIHARIHARFGEAITAGEPLLDELQPLLEECLLIHSPLAPVAR
ncbi:MAG: hypothetical protein MUF31_04990 [Akkermansiaceae bacterium]|jgi:hypothetical protein|nr:hypothetical protein [Akkermansiaceae bacterium]